MHAARIKGAADRSFNTTMVDEGLGKRAEAINVLRRFNTTMVDEKGENNDERSL